MSTRRFTQLAAKLYPLTYQGPQSFDYKIQDVPVSPAAYGYPQFDGLGTDSAGRMTVRLSQPFKTTPKETDRFDNDDLTSPASLSLSGAITYTMPVRAFVRLARYKLAIEELYAGLDTELRADGEQPLEGLGKLPPAYRDGLLALAKELDGRKAKAAAAKPGRATPYDGYDGPFAVQFRAD